MVEKSDVQKEEGRLGKKKGNSLLKCLERKRADKVYVYAHSISATNKVIKESEKFATQFSCLVVVLAGNLYLIVKNSGVIGAKMRNERESSDYLGPKNPCKDVRYPTFFNPLLTTV